MNIRQLEAFRSTVLAGTVSGAAALLGVSQPAVSRLLVQFENSLGLAIFERTRNRLTLTPEGRLLYDEVERTFLSVDRIRDLAEDLKVANAGNIYIASLPALALTLVPLAIRRFRKMHPRITISLSVQSSPKVEDWIAAQQFDFGLAQFPSGRLGLKSENFCSVPQVLIVPPGHPLGRRKVAGPKDLEGEPFISLTKATVGRHLVDKYFESRDIRRSLSLEAQYFGAVCKLVELGLGVGLVDPFTARDFRSRGGSVLAFRPSLEFEVSVLFPTHRPMSKPARQFLLTLRACQSDLLRGKTR